MGIQFKIRPVVIKGGTFDSVQTTDKYSVFNVYNEVVVGSGQIQERGALKIYFDYDVEETEDDFLITIHGVKHYHFVVTPVATYYPYTVNYHVYNDNGTIFRHSMTSGSMTGYDSGLIAGQALNLQQIRVSKDNEGVTPVSVKLVRFDDTGEDSSGDNFLELWLDGVIYVPPPEFKPWAIRKNGDFKTHDRKSGYFKIRKGSSWVDKSKNKHTDKNRRGHGKSQIRKNGAFVGQSKIGNQ